MKTSLLKFENAQFGELRGMNIDGAAWLMATDVARKLGYANPQKAVRDHVDEEDKTLNVSFTVNGTTPVLINESGLYSLILSSNLPQAREFKRWVTSEVLPQIRKTGGYIPIHRNNENENRRSSEGEKRAVASEEEILCRALQILQRTIEQKDRLLGAQSEALADMEPKALFHDAVQGAQNAIGISELAKLISQNGYEIGQRRLFQWMREHGYMGRVGEYYNIPMQRYIEQGLFCIKEFVYTDSQGCMHTTFTTKVTGKGQTYFIKLFCGRCTNYPDLFYLDFIA